MANNSVGDSRIITKNRKAIHIDHLIVFGGGVIEVRSGRYYAKSAVVCHLEELSSFFPRVTFVAARSDSHMYTTLLNTNKVRPVLWNFRKGVSSYIRLFGELGLRNPRLAVLLQVPQTPTLPFVPFLRLFAQRFLVYVAGDWVDINEELSRRGKRWRVPIDKAAAIVPIRLADAVLVRGPKLMRQVRRLNAKAFDSLPIIAQQSWKCRKDTCVAQEIRLIYVGKLLVGKGLGVLIESIAHLKAAEPQLGLRIRLTVIGAGHDEFSFKKQVHSLGLADCVEFLGYIDDPCQLSQAYQAADILVMPSTDSEGLPRVIEEGFMHNLPIIASKTGGIPQLYSDRVDMLLVPRGDAVALAHAVSELVSDGDLRRRLIMNANERSKMLRGGRTAARQHAEIILETAPIPDRKSSV